MASLLQKAKEAAMQLQQQAKLSTSSSFAGKEKNSDGSNNVKKSERIAENAFDKNHDTREGEQIKSQADIRNSKDPDVHKYHEENARLAAELEIMSDYQVQNVALKEQIQKLVAQLNEESKKNALINSPDSSKEDDDDFVKKQMKLEADYKEKIQLQQAELESREKQLKGLRLEFEETVSLLKQKIEHAEHSLPRAKSHIIEKKGESELGVETHETASLEIPARNLEKENEDLHHALQPSERQNVKLQHELSSIQSASAESMSKIQTFQKSELAMKDVTTDMAALKEQFDILMTDYKRANQELLKAQEGLKKLTSENEALRTNYDCEVKRTTSLREAFEKQLDEAREQLDRLRPQIQENNSTNDLNQKMLAVAREKEFVALLESKEQDFKSILEQKEKEFKSSNEQKDKDFKKVLEAKEKDIFALLEKKYKVEKDQMRSIQKQLEDKEKALKENEDNYSKRIRDLDNNLKQAKLDTEKRLKHFDETESQNRRLSMEVKALSDQLSGTSSKFEVMIAELDVARASQERVTKTLMERDDAFKKLKQKFDETFRRQSELQVLLEAKTEELLKLQSENASLLAKLNNADNIHTQSRTLQEEYENKLKKEKVEVETHKREVDVLKNKIAEMESENKAMERKYALTIKDYQKQLAKTQKHVSSSQENMDADGKFKPTSESNDSKRLIQELQTLSKENGNLGSKIAELQSAKAKTDEEMRHMTDRLQKAQKELENKSKLVLQYALRDNAARLQPSGTSAPLKQENKYLSMLSNPKVLQGVDPVVLTEINQKLQGIIEDLTTKNFELSEEMKGLKDLIRRNK